MAEERRNRTYGERELIEALQNVDRWHNSGPCLLFILGRGVADCLRRDQCKSQQEDCPHLSHKITTALEGFELLDDVIGLLEVVANLLRGVAVGASRVLT